MQSKKGKVNSSLTHFDVDTVKPLIASQKYLVDLFLPDCIITTCGLAFLCLLYCAYLLLFA